jgi:hypothetical protein
MRYIYIAISSKYYTLTREEGVFPDQDLDACSSLRKDGSSPIRTRVLVTIVKNSHVSVNITRNNNRIAWMERRIERLGE